MMKTFEEFINEELHHNTQADHDAITAHHNHLKTKDKEYLVKELGSRLDMSHAKSEPKANLINQALHNKFGKKKVESWGAKRIKK